MRTVKFAPELVFMMLRALIRADALKKRVSGVRAPSDEMPLFIRGLHECLATTPEIDSALPTWRTSIGNAVFSDYSDKSGSWTTYAFLCAPIEEVIRVQSILKQLRENHPPLEDMRQFEYKKLADRVRARALPEWLDVFDSMTGVAFVLLVHRDVSSAIHTNSPDEPAKIAETIRELGYGDWSTTRSGNKLLEDALRTLHMIGYLNARLSGPRVPLRWITDNDEIIAGAMRRKSVHALLTNIAEKYSGASTTVEIAAESDLQEVSLREFLSIPDLIAAGILQHQLGVDTQARDALPKAAAIMEWFGVVKNLQKVALQIAPDARTGIQWKFFRPFFAPDSSSTLNQASSGHA